jgi:hypothetical protein
MRENLIYLKVVIIVIVVSGLAFAHHGTAAYDTGKSTTVTGTVTDFQFANPHVQLSWDVKDENGDIQKWQGEITSPSQLARTGGWNKNSLKPGDEITVTGFPARNGSHTMVIRKVLLNGRELKISDN